MTNKFLINTSSIIYSKDSINLIEPKDITEVLFNHNDNNAWINTYGINYLEDFNEVISKNGLDDFLTLLIKENKHRNKTIELDSTMFLAINTVHFKNNIFTTEQMMFIVGKNFIWSIQEKHGDYFDDIRFRLRENKGLVRKKTSDYLLFLILDAIIDNYTVAFEKLNKKMVGIRDLSSVNPDQENVLDIERLKQQFFQLKKAITSLRDAIFKLEKSEIDGIETRYYIEAKEQAQYLIDDIDFDLSQLESILNLIFNLQNNRLNQVMKTLTIFSVIFIPLTFLAGIYGMNFDELPGSKSEYGFYYFILASFLITGLAIFMIKRKNWFK